MIKGSGHPPIDKICLFCKKSFQVKYKFRDQKCCSLRCTSLYGWSLKGHRKAKTMTCKTCHKKFQEIPSRIKKGKGKYCSRICYTIAMKQGIYTHEMPEISRIKLSKERKGKLNPAYIHGKSNGFVTYESTFSNLVKEKVMKRDNYTCQACGSINNILVHHIDHNPVHSVITNLVTWCRPCHAKHHSLERSNAT